MSVLPQNILILLCIEVFLLWPLMQRYQAKIVRLENGVPGASASQDSRKLRAKSPDQSQMRKDCQIEVEYVRIHTHTSERTYCVCSDYYFVFVSNTGK